jgi:hypothetical protein
MRHATDQANSRVFVSLQRMYSDPKNQREGVELDAKVDGYPIAAHELEKLNRALEQLTPPLPVGNNPEQGYRHWLFSQLLRVETELNALLLAVRK